MRDHNGYRGVLSRFIAAPGRIRIDFFASVAQEMYSKTHLSTYVNHDIDDDQYATTKLHKGPDRIVPSCAGLFRSREQSLRKYCAKFWTRIHSAWLQRRSPALSPSPQLLVPGDQRRHYYHLMYGHRSRSDRRRSPRLSRECFIASYSPWNAGDGDRQRTRTIDRSHIPVYIAHPCQWLRIEFLEMEEFDHARRG